MSQVFLCLGLAFYYIQTSILRFLQLLFLIFKNLIIYSKYDLPKSL